MFVAESDALKGQVAEAVSAVLLDVQARNNYTHILANGTVFGKVLFYFYSFWDNSFTYQAPVSKINKLHITIIRYCPRIFCQELERSWT